MNLRDLFLRARALFLPNRVERELNEELQFHIERETRKLIDEGMSPADARFKAQARFGSTTVAADECRDERGTAFVDNTISDFHYALRSFRRAPLSALTIVATVSLGLGVVAVLFTILNVFLFRIDTVPDITEMYEVARPELGTEVPLFTRPQFEAMRRETSVFSDSYATIIEVDLRVDGRVLNVALVTGNFFDVVRMRPTMGRALTVADDERGGAPVAVLSDVGWERRFNRDPNVLGRTVLVSGAPYEIIGVMPAGFRGLQVGAPDLWAPLSRVGDFQPNNRGREDRVAVEMVGRLKPGMTMENARAQLAAWDANQPVPATADRRVMAIGLLPRQGTVPQPMEALMVFTPLFIVFGLILMIGCANVANLLLARGVARQKEIGIRLSLGASRKRIVRQLMTESVLLALMSAAVGYVISRLALEGVVAFMMRTMPMDLGDVNLNVPASDWRVGLFLVVTAVFATAFFALLPALHATRVEPVRTMRGELVRDAKPGRARNALIGLQVFASALLLICAAIFLRSASASSQFDPGLRTSDTILIEINEQKRPAMLQEIRGASVITSYAAVRPHVLAPPLRAFADPGSGKTAVGYKFVSEPYFDVLGIPIVRGRAFTAAERDDQTIVIVSESVARALWPNGSGVGQSFRIEADLTPSNPYGLQVNPEPDANQPINAPRTVTVVGVSRDVPGFRLTDVRDAGVFLPTSLEAERTTAVARVNGDPTVAREALLERFTRIDPNMGQIITLRTVARLELFFLQIAFWVSVILGGLALLLTVSGLFSVLSYLVEQRTKEIGVRMALGASSQKVTQLMLAQTARPVVIGLVAGAGLAASLATLLLSSEAGAMISQIVRVTDPVAYVASLLVIVAACMLAAWIPARSAARVDPMKTLRQE